MNRTLSLLLFLLLISSNLFAERVIIFNDEYNKAIKSSSISKADHKVIRHSKGGFVVAEIDESKLKKSNIKYIPDKKIFRKASLPNDPDISNQWSISNTKLSNLWDLKEYNCNNVVVAVVDTGIDYTHEDLSANILINNSEIPGNNLDDDGNGFKDDYYGYDFAYDDNDPRDGDGHGSHVAGIVGAVINNGKGIAGVCNVKILPVKVLDDRGDGWISDVYEGVIYASNRGAKIINLSMEANSNDSEYVRLFNDAISYAKGKGAVVVVAGGNSGYDLLNNTVLPASLRNNHDNMFVVGSYNSSNNFSYFSNYAGLLMDIVAPGENIYSTFESNRYYTDTGTSMATPFVSGVVSYLLAHEPNLTFQEIRNRLYNATVKNSSFLGKALCDGKFDLSRLFSPIDRPIITKIDNTNPAYQQTVTLTGYFKNIDYLYWNNRSVAFNKLDDYRISFKIPFLEIGETFGVLKAVYNGQESNSIVIKPNSVITTTTASVSINLSSGSLSILETGYYPVSGYQPVGEGVKFYISSSNSLVKLTITKNQVTSSDANITYGALVDEDGNQRVVSSESGVYVYDNVSTNKTYFFVEVSAGSSGGGGCFIATAVFGSYLDPHVKVLRDFRDRYLLTNSLGRWFVEKYYKYSPPIADYIRDKEGLKFLVRIILIPIVLSIKHFYLTLFLLLVGMMIIYKRIRIRKL